MKNTLRKHIGLVEAVYTSQEAHAIATTIRQQLGGNRFSAMTGAKNFVSGCSEEGCYLSFQLPRAEKKIKAVQITLNGNDLYNLFFYKRNPHTFEIVPIEKIDDVHVENLREVFEQVTGLRTSL